MELLELSNAIQEAFLQVELVESVYNNDAAYIWNNKDVHYVSVCFDLVSVTNDGIDHTYTFNFYAGDRQKEDIDSTTTENYDKLIGVLNEGFRSFMENLENAVDVNLPITYTCARLRMADVLAVVTAQVSFTVPVYGC